MKRIFYVISLATLLLTASCGNEVKDENAVIIGKKKVIEKFPASATLDEKEGILPDEMGIFGFTVRDSIMVVGHSSHWSIYSSDGNKKYGDVLSRGEGPLDFTYLPYCSAVFYGNENDSLVAYLPDIRGGKMIRLNISAVTDSNQNCLSLAYKLPDIQMAWDMIPTGKDGLLVSEPNKTLTGFKRLIYDSQGNFKEPQVTAQASEIVVGNEMDNNLLARMTRYEPSNGNFVEAMYSLNQLNVFSKEGDDGMTLTVGQKKLDNVAEVEALDRKDRVDQYLAVSTWPVGFGALYHGSSYNEIEESGKDGVQIQFFDWEGNPIFLATEPYLLTEFDIDFDKKILYALDKTDDKIRAFDATPIIEAYNKKK